MMVVLHTPTVGFYERDGWSRDTYIGGCVDLMAQQYAVGAMILDLSDDNLRLLFCCRSV